MRYVKRYAEGGKLPPGKLGDLMHALKYYSSPKGDKYSTEDLLQMLKYTKGGEKVIEQKEREDAVGSASGVDFGSAFGDSSLAPEPSPEFEFHKEFKKSKTPMISQKVGVNKKGKPIYTPPVSPMALKKSQLESLAGRPLSDDEAGELRMSMLETTKLKYLMDENEDPKSREFEKYKILRRTSAGQGSSGSSKEGGGGCVGEGCDLIRKGLSHSWSD
jgi:hypothetical protein